MACFSQSLIFVDNCRWFAGWSALVLFCVLNELHLAQDRHLSFDSFLSCPGLVSLYGVFNTLLLFHIFNSFSQTQSIILWAIFNFFGTLLIIIVKFFVEKLICVHLTRRVYVIGYFTIWWQFLACLWGLWFSFRSHERVYLLIELYGLHMNNYCLSL